MKNHHQYIPALRFHFLTPLYDAALKYIMREQRFKEELCKIIPTQAEKILDAGCGTGTLTAMMKRTHSLSEVHGIDIDDTVLTIARKKFERNSQHIILHQGTILQLPFENNSFDAVFGCLVLHHLNTQQKQEAIKEIFRVLKPGGIFAVADFSTPHTIPMMAITLVTQYLEETYDNFHGRLLEFIPNAGFIHPDVHANFWTPMGTVSIITAIKPTIS